MDLQLADTGARMTRDDGGKIRARCRDVAPPAGSACRRDAERRASRARATVLNVRTPDDQRDRVPPCCGSEPRSLMDAARASQP